MIQDNDGSMGIEIVNQENERRLKVLQEKEKKLFEYELVQFLAKKKMLFLFWRWPHYIPQRKTQGF